MRAFQMNTPHLAAQPVELAAQHGAVPLQLRRAVLAPRLHRRLSLALHLGIAHLQGGARSHANWRKRLCASAVL